MQFPNGDPSDEFVARHSTGGPPPCHLAGEPGHCLNRSAILAAQLLMADSRADRSIAASDEKATRSWKSGTKTRLGARGSHLRPWGGHRGRPGFCRRAAGESDPRPVDHLRGRRPRYRVAARDPRRRGAGPIVPRKPRLSGAVAVPEDRAACGFMAVPRPLRLHRSRRARLGLPRPRRECRVATTAGFEVFSALALCTAARQREARRARGGSNVRPSAPTCNPASLGAVRSRSHAPRSSRAPRRPVARCVHQRNPGRGRARRDPPRASWLGLSTSRPGCGWARSASIERLLYRSRAAYGLRASGGPGLEVLCT